MDKEIYNKLEMVKDNFNNDIRKTFEEGKPKINLENDIDAIIDEYSKRVSGYFNSIEHGYRVKTHFEDALNQLKRRLNNRTTDITLEVSEFLRDLNNKEFDKNMEVLSDERATDEAKKEELDKNSRYKISKVEDEKSGSDRDTISRAESLKEEADRILYDTCNYAKKLVMTSASGRQLMLAMSKVEAMTMGISNISKDINNRLGDGYIEAVRDYKESVYEAYTIVNEGYENKVSQIAGLELDIAKPENPFRLSDDIIKKVERVGREPVKPRENKEERSYGKSLPGNIL